MQKNKGFTLIEILVVCAVIAILAGAVVMATGPSRAKALDSRRISDIAQIQAALESYFAEQPRTNPKYPAALSELDPEQIAQVPTDPTGQAYFYLRDANNVKHYCLGATLQVQGSSLLRRDAGCESVSSTYNYVVRR